MKITRDTLWIKGTIPIVTPKFSRQKLIAKILIWLSAEILLSFLGLDNLADYSEFIYEKPIEILIA